jgi:hypothetical protein
MAFCGEYMIEQLEQSIAALRLAASEPDFINMRILSTNQEGVCEIEVLQRDLPFTSPFFTKTSVFEHPDIDKVEFRHWPNPHFWIIGTVQGVKSAMLRRYAYFIQREAVSFFKAVSSGSLISRKGSHLLPGRWECARMQAKLPKKTVTYDHLPGLERLGRIPLAIQSAASRAIGPDPQTSQTPTVDPIPQVNFRRFDQTIDKICRPKTPTPTTDFSTLPTIHETDPPDTLPYTDDWDSTDADEPAIATDPIDTLPITDDDWD